MERPSGSPESGVRVELYVRSLSPRESRRAIERVVERLDRLVDDGAITEFRVVPTGAAVPPTPADAVTEFSEFVLHRIAVFEDWARATGRSLGNLFERRSVTSSFTGEDHDAIHMPTMVMAEYGGAALRFVAPCFADGERVTVEDRLDELAIDEHTGTDQTLPGAGVREPPGPTRPAE